MRQIISGKIQTTYVLDAKLHYHFIFCNPNFHFSRNMISFLYLRTMKRIKVFNPEHDLALANGDSHFIAPKNIREMARDLAPLLEVVDTDDITVWGWDSVVTNRLCKMGVSRAELPSEEALAALSRCSERKTAHLLLQAFRARYPYSHYIGESILIGEVKEITPYVAQHQHVLLKNPLSSSGKGLRHVSHGTDWSKTGEWAEALIRRHGYLTAEPYYDKVQDFAMEFYVDGNGCRFIGYSLFVTDHHGRYIGSNLMGDERIEAQLAYYVPRTALHKLRDWIVAHHTYIVPAEWDTTHHPLHFGIDMMIVSESQRSTDNIQPTPMARGERLSVKETHPDGNSEFRIQNSEFKIHPCVEINLRMNMGIIAHEVYRRLLAPEAEGMFHLAFFADAEALCSFHQENACRHPVEYSDGRLLRGYLPLTPINSGTRHHAYVICK